MQPNFIDAGFRYFFETFDNSIFVNILLWPFKEVLSIFLYLDDEKHFSPMHEFQAYFFMTIMYPFIWIYMDIFAFFHMSIAPVMMFWMAVDPELFIVGERENGTNIPRNNYARVYAEVKAVTQILTGDFNYLYWGKESFTIGFLEIMNYYSFSWIFYLINPLVEPFILFWAFVSGFQLMVIYIYVEVIKGQPSAEQ